MICLDTNVVIAAINGRIPSVRQRLGEELIRGADLGLPAVALFELRYGYAKSSRRAEAEAILATLLGQGIAILPFGEEDAAHSGAIRAELERDGNPIGAYDILIAGQARSRGATLATANAREFARVSGLPIIDWTT
jgi:tRNA(fMet)-specific endonuclease VapC